MKTGVSLSAFPAKPGMPVLFSANLRENIRTIKELGYDGVDLFVLDPRDEASILARTLLREHGLGVGVVMPAALARAGLFLGDASGEIRQEILSRMAPIIDYAAELGAMVSLGLVRGGAKEGDTVAACLDRFADSCAKLLPVAKSRGVKLVVEPINRYEINTLNSSMEALDFIKTSGLDLGLMLDTFHMNIEDASFEESFTACAGRTAHIHFLDSNRLAPGMGHLDMQGLYDTIRRTGYAGYLCLEALPLPDSLTCARHGAAFFSRQV